MSSQQSAFSQSKQNQLDLRGSAFVCGEEQT